MISSFRILVPSSGVYAFWMGWTSPGVSIVRLRLSSLVGWRLHGDVLPSPLAGLASLAGFRLVVGSCLRFLLDRLPLCFCGGWW